MDLSRIERIETDDTLLDEEGHPRKDALIFEDKIICHPDVADKLLTALTIFFKIDISTLVIQKKEQ